jgi:hypothetical protein
VSVANGAVNDEKGNNLMEPSEKDPAIDNFLKDAFGVDRKTAIRACKCLPPPIGCGRTFDPNTEFKDEISRREYRISGLCAFCQDKIFGG